MAPGASAFPPPQAISKGAVAMASASPTETVCDIVVSLISFNCAV
jgi:hypothetical protein